MGKSLQAAVAVTCVMFVLAIFIAPSVDMPETLLPLHHTTLRASGAQAGTVAGFTAAASFAVPQDALGSWHGSRFARPSAPVVRKVSTVLRC
jgi:hypothetical protein